MIMNSNDTRKLINKARKLFIESSNEPNMTHYQKGLYDEPAEPESPYDFPEKQDVDADELEGNPYNVYFQELAKNDMYLSNYGGEEYYVTTKKNVDKDFMLYFKDSQVSLYIERPNDTITNSSPTLVVDNDYNGLQEIIQFLLKHKNELATYDEGERAYNHSMTQSANDAAYSRAERAFTGGGAG